MAQNRSSGPESRAAFVPFGPTERRTGQEYNDPLMEDMSVPCVGRTRGRALLRDHAVRNQAGVRRALTPRTQLPNSYPTHTPSRPNKKKEVQLTDSPGEGGRETRPASFATTRFKPSSSCFCQFAVVCFQSCPPGRSGTNLKLHKSALRTPPLRLTLGSKVAGVSWAELKAK
jgi:hypothetical protein